MEPPTLEDRRLTARQRARLEKEAGLAEDVQWHEMAMPPELAYTWKGKGECSSFPASNCTIAGLHEHIAGRLAAGHNK
jgi:hypothetical protein